MDRCLTVKEAIELLKTMPQEAQLLVGQNCGGREACYSIKVEEVRSLFRDVKLTAVVVDVN